jgi:trans-aconitate methyltransferase
MAHEFDGKQYEKASAHQKEWGTKLIAELDLRGRERVLDLGCGDGALTAEIAEAVPAGEVVGIDASQGMIDAALPKARANLRFLLMDINKLNFADQFDVVYSNATLHWVKDHRRLLENVHRALRAGGRIRFNFAGDGNCARFFKVIRKATALKEFASSFAQFAWPWYMPSVDEYRALLESSEFHDARVWGENADRHFPNEEAIIRWVDQPNLVPFLAHVGIGKKDAFREFVVRRMIEETKERDGRCFETFRRINVSARK